MNISKALKVKNRLVGVLSGYLEQAKTFNVTDEGEDFKLPLHDVWANIESTRNALIELKERIAIASAGIAGSLVELAERKSEIQFLKSLPIQTGKQHSYSAEILVKKSYINLEANNTKIADVQARINELQDLVDDYNASTLLPVSTITV